VACFERALAALARLPESRDTLRQGLDLRLNLHGPLSLLLEFERIFNNLCAAETLAQNLGEQQSLVQVYCAMTNYLRMTGEPDRALALAERALTLVAPLEDVGLQARAYQQLGQVYHTVGDYRRAMDILARTVAILQGAPLYEDFGGTNPVSVGSLHWLNRCRAEVGAFAEGLAEADAALRLAEAANRPSSLVEACQWVSILHLYKRDVHRAIPGLERVLDLCRTWDMPLYVPTAASALGYAYTLCGRHTEGMLLLEQGVEQTVAEGIKVNVALWVTRVGEASLLAGRLEDAHAHAVQALELAGAYKERGHEAWAVRLIGEIATHREPPEVESAAAHYLQALALAEELDMRPLQAHCHLGLGTLYLKTDRSEPARVELTTAIALYRALEMTFWLPQAQEALARAEVQPYPE